MTAHGEELASCGRAAPVALAGSFYGYGNAGAVDLFAVDVHPGTLMVEAVVAADARVEPKLALFDQHCRSTERAGHGFTVIERRVNGMVVEITKSGTLRFAVAPQSRRRMLGPYKLVTRFVAKTKSGIEEPEPDPEPNGYSGLCDPDAIDGSGDLLLCATSLDLGTKAGGHHGPRRRHLFVHAHQPADGARREPR